MLRNSSATNVSSAASKRLKQYPTSSEDYEVLDVVGQGVSAKVFRALCRPLNEIVAVKTIELEGINSSLEEIMREAKTMRLAQHSNILSLHCSFVTKENVLWMVMPYVGGGSVLSIMKWAYRDGLEENCIASVMCEVLKSVAYMHKNNFIHRDIKAGNILVDLDGHVKLGDFGVAATMERTGSWGKEGNVRQTFVGTPCWMAPEVMEQIEGYDWHADIWSFGITMLELAHGHAPFAKYPPMKVLLMTLQNEPPKLEESYKQRHFSKAMREVVQLCLQKDPKRRPTAAKLLEHRLFKNAHHDKGFIVKHLLKGLPSLVERVHNLSNTIQKQSSIAKDVSKLAAQQEMETKSQDAYVKGVSAWDFDVTAWKEDAAETASKADANDPHEKPAESKLAAIQTSGAASGPGSGVPVTSPLSIKQKTPGAHKSRFKINLDDDDDTMMMNSPPENISLTKRRMSKTNVIGDTVHSKQTATGGSDNENVKKKEQRGRFWVSGENDDEKDEMQVMPKLKEMKVPKRQLEPSLQSSEQSTIERDAAGDASNIVRVKDAYQVRSGGTGDASVPPHVLQYLQSMQMNLQHQQDTLNYLVTSAGGSGGLRSGSQKIPVPSNLMSPRPHSLNESSQQHALLLKNLEEMTLSVRGVCDENDKLKKRNVQLERELTKCQNKLLELQEAKEKEEEEEEMKQIERVSSEVISDRDHARHMANTNRSLSDKSLAQSAEKM